MLKHTLPGYSPEATNRALNSSLPMKDRGRRENERPGVRGFEAAQEPARPVRRPVVHDDDLERQIRLRRTELRDARERRRETPLLAVIMIMETREPWVRRARQTWMPSMSGSIQSRRTISKLSSRALARTVFPS